MSGHVEELEAPDDVVEFNRWAQARGISDGLPLIPPTPERVRAFLATDKGDPKRTIAKLAPNYASATVERIAINAVMAGCEPGCIDVLIAAVAAIAEPSFNLDGVQPTTHPCGVMMMVNGPRAREVGLHCGSGLFGPGFPANATIGRAMRLMLWNIGGAVPGVTDRATHGTPAKFTFCFAENEVDSPWEPYHVRMGFPAGSSTVTVEAAEGPHNINDHASKEPAGVLAAITNTVASMGANNAYLRNSDYFVGLGPEHARILADAGWTIPDIQSHIHRNATIPYRTWRRGSMFGIFPQPLTLQVAADDDPVPMSDRPEDVRIVVVGGPGRHSVWIPTVAIGRSVTRRIET
jgi:hypothetical protein